MFISQNALISREPQRHSNDFVFGITKFYLEMLLLTILLLWVAGTMMFLITCCLKRRLCKGKDKTTGDNTMVPSQITVKESYKGAVMAADTVDV